MSIYCGVCLDNKHLDLLDGELNLYRCRECNHTITAHPEPDPEMYSVDYYSEEHKNWFAHPNIRHFKFLYKTLLGLKSSQKIRFLDVGCGNGDFLKYLSKTRTDLELYGIDTADNQHPGIHFIKGDFFKYEADRMFGVVSNLLVIEHIEDVHSFMKKMSDCLLPGGILFITTNNNDSLLYRTARFLSKLGMRTAFNRIYSSHHVQHFTNRSLKRLLEIYGFKVLHHKNHNYPLKAVDTPPAPYLIRRLHLAAVAVIFCLSFIFKNGFLQTYICEKKSAQSN